jgi:hypothetical protein
MSATYKHPSGAIYNLHHIAAVKDVSGWIKPGYYYCKETCKKTWWQKVFNLPPYRIAGKYYIRWEDDVVSKEQAVHKFAVRVWKEIDSVWPDDWEFDTEEQKNEFLQTFQSFQDYICKFKS